MPDLSTLRIAVDSRDVVNATSNLQGMGRAADSTESALQGLGQAADSAENALQGVGTAADSAESALGGVGGATARTSAGLASMRGFARQANEAMAAGTTAAAALGASHGLASHHVTNLAFQVQDLGVQLAGGANPMVAFAQQGSQISGIMMQAGMGVGSFSTAIASMLGLVKVSSSAAADGALAVASAQQAQIASAARAAQASMAAAETEVILAEANVEVAVTAEASAAAQTRLAAASARLVAAQTEAVVSAEVLAVAEAEVAVAATAAAAATTVALAPLAIILAGVAVAAAGVYAAFKLFQSSVASTGEVQKYADSLGLTKKEMQGLKDVHVTFGDALSGVWKTISDGMGLSKVWKWISDTAVDAFKWTLDAAMKATAGIYAGFMGTYDAIKIIWKNLPAVMGDVFVQVANKSISAVESLINAVIGGINFVAAKANGIMKEMGIAFQFANVETVKLNRLANENAGAAAKVTAQVFDAYASRYQEALSGMRAIGIQIKQNILDATKARLLAEANVIKDKRGEGPKPGQSDAAKELERQTKAAEDFIAATTKQAETLGMTAIQLKEYEIKAAAAAAPTETLKNRIIEVGAALIEGMKAQNLNDFIKNTIAPLEFENTLLGENARQRAVATAERAMELAQIERGSDAWNRYLAAVNAAQDGVKTYQDAFLAMKSDVDLAGVFGDAGKAMGGLLNTFDKLIERQEAYAKAVGEANGDTKKLQAIQSQQTKMQLNNYGNMVGAAKGFFKEGSKGYKALDAAEKVFRAAELAIAIKNAAVKIGLLGATTAAAVTGSAAEVAATASAEAAKTGATAAGTAVRTPMKVAEGAASMFASLGPLGFVAVAAMLAAMAALGFSGGGSKGKPPAANTGTGTVFGDSTKQSESIQKSIELLANVDTLTMRYSAQMASSLRNIEGNIGGLTNLVLRTNGMAGSAAGVQEGTKVTGALGLLTGAMNKVSNVLGSNTGSGIAAGIGFALAGPVGAAIGFIGSKLLGAVGSIIGSVVKALFGTKTSIVGQGITGASQSLGGIVDNGFQGQYYTDVKKTKKFFGISTGSSYSTQTTAADAELNRQFSLIFTGFYDAISAAAVPLGLSLTDVEKRLNGFVVNIGKIDLKGLTGDQINEKLTAVFGAAADSIARAAIPGLDVFQKVGEGYFETVVRVSSGIEQAGVMLQQLGVKAIAYTEILNTQGDVAAEIIRQSILVNEASLGVAGGFAEIIQNANGTAEELVGLVNQLRELQKMVVVTGKAAIDLTTYMILGAGGADALATGLQAFYDNVLTDAERNNMALTSLAKQFGNLGQAFPTTLAGFAALIASIDTTTSAGQQLYGSLIALTPAFVDVIDAANAARDAAAQAETSAIDNLRSAVDGLNSDVAKAETALATAVAAAAKKQQDAAKAVLQTQLDGLKEQQKAATAAVNQFDALGQSMRSFSDSIMPLTEGGAGLAALQQQFASVATRAQLGDTQAMGDLPGIGKSLVDATMANASDRTSMIIALAAIKAQTDAAIGTADRQKTIAEQQLEALNTQITGVTDQIAAIGATTEAVLSVADAQAALDAARAARENALMEINRAGFADLLDVSTQSNAQLVTIAIAAIKQAQAQQVAADAAAAAAVVAAQQAAADAAAVAAANAAAAAAAAAQAAADAAAAAATTATVDYAAIAAWMKANGYSIPGFAAGGDFGGGLRIVGENGPELQATGPSRIYNANQTAAMLQGGETADEMKALRQELKYAMFTIAKNTGKTADQLNRWDGDGMPEVRTVAA